MPETGSDALSVSEWLLIEDGVWSLKHVDQDDHTSDEINGLLMKLVGIIDRESGRGV